MTTEKVDINGTQAKEPEKVAAATKTVTRSQKLQEDKQASALSVKEKSAKGSHGLQLLTEPSYLPGNRPIEASHLNIVSTYGSLGTTRPVVASGMEVSGTLTISGERPIMASHLHISETYNVMGDRPVASNEIDDPELLMGFLD
ncbi:hypothetical protein [Aphanothece sacrum]|uniref:Catalase/hydroperoxidase n=1 Tax=Aphanothece sacrum FPU1 TaxID=1920663 RepID=A0A401II96_APHSA|nr:hypothetical protein [Aphanothece sacrum]GBF80984.1 catalase/hydroperoxidase [Aphanothece sacrum FPU1]GBF85291.1 catalase/hydroperoxidase [Aphanothece sacrum FPU3]